MLIERKKCPLCNNAIYKQLYSINYNDKRITNYFLHFYGRKKIKFFYKLKNFNYEINECEKCKFIFQKNIPNNIFSSILYEKIVHDKEEILKKKKISDNLSGIKKEIKLFRKLIKKRINKISILEIGAGYGNWAEIIRSAGFDITLNEFAKNRIKDLKNNNFKICSNLENHKKKYDIIYSNQVIEHVNNPLKIFLISKKLLKKNGFIYFRFPSSLGLKTRLKNKYIPCKDCAQPLEHINIFNKECFKNLEKKLKLKICRDNYHSFINPKKYLKSLRDYYYCDQILLKKL